MATPSTHTSPLYVRVLALRGMAGGGEMLEWTPALTLPGFLRNANSRALCFERVRIAHPARSSGSLWEGSKGGALAGSFALLGAHLPLARLHSPHRPACEWKGAVLLRRCSREEIPLRSRQLCAARCPSNCLGRLGLSPSVQPPCAPWRSSLRRCCLWRRSPRRSPLRQFPHVTSFWTISALSQPGR